jgi:hypothetical protein
MRRRFIKEEMIEDKADRVLTDAEYWLKQVTRYGNEVLSIGSEDLFAAMNSDTDYISRVDRVRKNLQAAAQELIDISYDIEDGEYFD